MKITLWALNVLLAAGSAWALWPDPTDLLAGLEFWRDPAPARAEYRQPDPSVLLLRLPLGPRIEDTPPEALPRVRGVLTGREYGSGVAFLEDPRAKTEFAVLRGETIGAWTVASVGLDEVILRGAAGDRVLPVQKPR